MRLKSGHVTRRGLRFAVNAYLKVSIYAYLTFYILQTEFTLPSNSQIVFEGIAGTGYMGDIAIDDIMVYHTSNCDIKPLSALPKPPEPTPVPTPPCKFLFS